MAGHWKFHHEPGSRLLASHCNALILDVGAFVTIDGPRGNGAIARRRLGSNASLGEVDEVIDGRKRTLGESRSLYNDLGELDGAESALSLSDANAGGPNMIENKVVSVGVGRILNLGFVVNNNELPGAVVQELDDGI